MTDAKKIAANDKEEILALQRQLNLLHALNKRPGKAPQVTGELDEQTQKAWIRFKKDSADESLSLGFLKDKTGLGFSEAELQALGVDLKNPAAYDRNNPPEALIKAVQKKLGLLDTGQLEHVADAIIHLKRTRWIDGSITPGSLKELDEQVMDRVVGLQIKLNKVKALTAPKGEEPALLEVNGRPDDKETMAAWLQFKRTVYANKTLSRDYLVEGLKFGEEQLKAFGDYDPANPPKELVQAVQEKLKLPPTGKMDEATEAGIKADKTREGGWIDYRVNPGALDLLDKTIKSLEEARKAGASEDIHPAEGKQVQALTARLRQAAPRGMSA